MPRFVATLRAVFDAVDDVEAIFVADRIRENGATDLDEDEGDLLDVTQVTSNQLDLSPMETIIQLRRARNLLIKTRIKECFHLARELDQQIYALEHRRDHDFAMAGYQYGDFMDLADMILTQGIMPEMSSVVVDIVVRDDEGKAQENVTFGYVVSADREHDRRVAKAVGNSVKEWLYNNVPKGGESND